MNPVLADHSFEEIRAVALDILSGRERLEYEPGRYDDLMAAIAQVLAKRENFPTHLSPYIPLTQHDKAIYLEVFWDLFRQGITTLGRNDSNRTFPDFRVSEFGRKIIAQSDLYFYHDVSSYEKVIRENAPGIEDGTITYLKEAMQAFMSGCLLSSSVMLGVAAEDAFLTLLDTVENNPDHTTAYKNVFSERTIHRKIEKFRNILMQQAKSLKPEVLEDLDIRLFGIQSMIREFRNDAGHPTGKIPSREQCYVMLTVFIPCCKKIHQLIDYYR